MIIVNVVDSFCKNKLEGTTGNGEAKLYLGSQDSLDFIENYLGIDMQNGHNIYSYNDEYRIRTRGFEKRCYISKKNLLDFINLNSNEYEKKSKYRTNIIQQAKNNKDYLQNINNKDYFTIDLSLSKGRIYIGSSSDAWNIGIRGISLPRITQVKIQNINNSCIFFELV
ncbi:MAG: hypothetical protein ACRDAQ_12910 [Cetobacterium sp.]